MENFAHYFFSLLDTILPKKDQVLQMNWPFHILMWIGKQQSVSGVPKNVNSSQNTFLVNLMIYRYGIQVWYKVKVYSFNV